MSKILILGDVHGNTHEGVFQIQNAAALDIEVIIQCGDMGIWPGKSGMDYLDDLNAELIDKDILWVFVDGNHEDYNQLDRAAMYNPKNQWGQIFMRSNIIWSPRGCKWKLYGKHFMTVGGAVSIDKAWRKEGVSWWPQEQLTDEQLDKIIQNHEASPGKIDYLITHDSPSNAPFGDRIKDDLESTIHRRRMDRLGEAIKPSFWWHGHMHSKYDGYDFPTYNSTTKVYGLECDGMDYSWGVLDTETDMFQWGADMNESLYF